MVLSSEVPVIIVCTDRTSLHFHSTSYIISLSWILSFIDWWAVRWAGVQVDYSSPLYII